MISQLTDGGSVTKERLERLTEIQNRLITWYVLNCHANGENKQSAAKREQSKHHHNKRNRLYTHTVRGGQFKIFLAFQ